MNYFDAIILGFVQGITEFLPISSSGHLLIVSNLLGINFKGIVFEVIVHFGTLFSLIFFFRYKIFVLLRKIFIQFDLKSLNNYIIAILPIGIFGVLFKSNIEKIFNNHELVGFFLIFTGFILFFSQKFKKNIKSTINFKNSLKIGLFQILALMPGISRSGITISIGMMLGIKPKEAANFSFLISIPIILGSSIISINDIQYLNLSVFEIQFLIISFISSFIFGTLSLKILYNIINANIFHYFGYYCIIIGIISLIFI